MGGWVSGRNHQSSIWGQNRLKQLRNGPLHLETVVADVFIIPKDWLQLDDFDNAESIWWQYVKMLLIKCASEGWEARKKERRGNKQRAIDLGELASNMARSNLRKLPNATFMILNSWVLNGKSIIQAPTQLYTWYTNVRY